MNLKVLIVDDDPTIKLLHRAIVVKSNLSAQPLVFGDGKAAFDYFSTQYDENENYLILLDINMPVMNGWDFLGAIQDFSFANKLRVIMVTSSVDSADKENAKQFPQVIGYLEKPLKVDACNFIKTIPAVAPFFA
ncbi:response regulator [Parasediminibacterium sp. JCM 36343]|uniref:response regulator n=1 Tax=Parasediminibacterium sp. JCM 36343 TaxID=3374279 RepID=UPI00397A57B8